MRCSPDTRARNFFFVKKTLKYVIENSQKRNGFFVVAFGEQLVT